MTFDRKISRRTALKVAAAAATLPACRSSVPEAAPTPAPSSAVSKQPVVFLPHGGGPWPFMHEPMGGAEGWAEMDRYMRALNMVPTERPEAILVISAHWEERAPTIQSGANPPLLYDYSGFPPETYELEWPAPGAPDLAGEVVAHLQRAGFDTRLDEARGFDHGVFVPLKLGYPDADVPCLQLSLKAGLDPAEHIAMGRAIAPLREQGVFIVGSGMSYHNMRAFRSAMRGAPEPLADSRAFDEWMAETSALGADVREQRLVEWEQAPAARACHPREEHLIPLHVCAGVAEGDAGTTPYRDVVMGVQISAVHFG